MSAVTIARCAPADIVDLRWRVLRAGLPRESACFPGDDVAIHVAARDDGGIVGCATLMMSACRGEPAWQLRGMATAERRRGQGVGRALLLALEDIARAHPTRLLWCNARVSALGFYERLGWTTDSEEFDIPTAGPHRRMSRRLAS